MVTAKGAGETGAIINNLRRKRRNFMERRKFLAGGALGAVGLATGCDCGDYVEATAATTSIHKTGFAAAFHGQARRNANVPGVAPAPTIKVLHALFAHTVPPSDLMRAIAESEYPSQKATAPKRAQGLTAHQSTATDTLSQPPTSTH